MTLRRVDRSNAWDGLMCRTLTPHRPSHPTHRQSQAHKAAAEEAGADQLISFGRSSVAAGLNGLLRRTQQRQPKAAAATTPKMGDRLHFGSLEEVRSPRHVCRTVSVDRLAGWVGLVDCCCVRASLARSTALADCECPLGSID